ncbi:MAG: hypothetical protein NTV24_05005 [Candidatus Woesebacteria bacterium]|nr:hypothetical protein [Candidatus Woesebacteria bacterium]
MKLLSNVKIKPRFWEFLPWFSSYTAQAIYPNIYFPKETYEKLCSKNPDLKYVAVLLHEQTHIERQRKLGWVKWGAKYALFPKFRFNEELEAIKVQMSYLKKHNRKFDVEKGARYLSGWLYFRPVSYKTVRRILEKVWKGI